MQYLRTIYTIWYRDILRFWRNKLRVITGFSFPIIWLAFFGTGISASLTLPVTGITFLHFLFPGVMAQYLIFTALFGAISILQDREFGFLKEILVAPVSRSAIAIGKVFGGATSATLTVIPLVIIGPFIGVPVSVRMIIYLILSLALLSLCLSALGVAIVSKMKSLDSGQYIFQFITFPIVMLSGAFFPLRGLPMWLNILTKINPISYAVDIIRRTVFMNFDGTQDVATSLSPTINGNVLSMQFEILIVVVFTILMILLASRAFNST